MPFYIPLIFSDDEFSGFFLHKVCKPTSPVSFLLSEQRPPQYQREGLFFCSLFIPKNDLQQLNNLVERRLVGKIIEVVAWHFHYFIFGEFTCFFDIFGTDGNIVWRALVG